MKKIETKIKNNGLVIQRRKQIIDAALELFLKKGYHATTIREISRESGVNIGSLYDYVGSKEDILVLIYKEVMEQPMWREKEARLDKKALKIRSLRKFLKHVISKSWTLRKREIQVLYREAFALDRETLKEVLAIESNFVEQLSKELKKRTMLEDMNEDKIEVIANLLAFICAFIPLRGWNMRKYDPEFIVDVTADLFKNILE